ncbi:T9SS type A sorting domain-containing protein [Flavobacterium sp. SM15]|uniref:T9SS type A sorting domain-containing protein n=1 Tax=Flavobacterium sp. SM15 TaxID=2908005 RepID=UPI001EDB03B6|nr:T9SS type A sorting domain-containing protein [Flavobacterium sp. SM15]MCG2611582.1 T9SS type A sorting domain-containing protein [Flavobacterium sp. SM15]
MKKTLFLFVGSMISSLSMNAQVLQNENFDALTLGNVGTDITGATAGQDGWFTASSNGAAPTTSTNASNTNFQIVSNGNNATNGLKITTADGNKGSRFMWKDGLVAAWDARTSGNDVIQVEFDIYSGPATTSKTQVGVRAYGTDAVAVTSRVIGGFVLTMDTKVLNGLAYLNNAGTYNTYLVNLAAAPGIVLAADTWYRIGFAYDSVNGKVTWKGPGFYTSLPAANWAGPFPPEEVDFVSSTPTTNAASTDAMFDSLVTTAVATEALLGVNQLATINSKKFNIFPNPANNFVTVSNDDNVAINKVTLTDINGRTVKTVDANGVSQTQINISELNAGVYFLNIDTNEGSATKKIIKN